MLPQECVMQGSPRPSKNFHNRFLLSHVRQHPPGCQHQTAQNLIKILYNLHVLHKTLPKIKISQIRKIAAHPPLSPQTVRRADKPQRQTSQDSQAHTSVPSANRAPVGEHSRTRPQPPVVTSTVTSVYQRKQTAKQARRPY